MIEVLLKHGAYVDITEGRNVSYEENTCLNIACKRGDLEMIRLLLKYKADMTAYNQGGHSPFTTAYTRGNKEAVDLFLEHGVDLNCNKSGYLYEKDGQWVPITDKWTPLMYACDRGDIDMVKRLLAHGADVNVMSQSGIGHPYYVTTAVVLSIDKEAILQLLLDHGADLSLTDRRGNTALLTLLTEREEAGPVYTPHIFNGVRMLLEHSMDVMHENNRGKTALDYVATGSEIEALLKEYVDRKPVLK